MTCSACGLDLPPGAPCPDCIHVLDARPPCTLCAGTGRLRDDCDDPFPCVCTPYGRIMANKGTGPYGEAMSLDWYLEHEVDFGGPDGPETLSLFERNITHNLRPMWRLAKVHDVLYAWQGRKAYEASPLLLLALEDMRARPDAYRALNPRNGWGTYEGAIEFLEACAAACRRYPRATIRISA